MKNYNGGYLIIDLANNDLTSSNTINGIYDKIEGNYRKPILFSGITIDGVEKPDTFATVETSDTDFVVKLYDRTVTITSSDVVSSVAGGNHLYEVKGELYIYDKSQNETRCSFKGLTNTNNLPELRDITTFDQMISILSKITNITTILDADSTIENFSNVSSMSIDVTDNSIIFFASYVDGSNDTFIDNYTINSTNFDSFDGDANSLSYTQLL